MEIIRKPTDHESNDCVNLIILSGPKLFEYLYTINNTIKLNELFSSFFYNHGNTYSRENILIEEDNSIIRGLVIAHPVNQLQKLLINEIKCIRKISKNIFSYIA